MSICAVVPTTAARIKFLPALLKQWHAQTLDPKQRRILVIHDGSEVMKDFCASRGLAHFWVENCPLGEKFNFAMEWARRYAKCDFISLWEDDDWSGPTRLQSEHAVLSTNLYSATALAASWFHDYATRETRWLQMPRHYIHGTYAGVADLWYRHPYPVRDGFDWWWQEDHGLEVGCAPFAFVGGRHGANTWKSPFSEPIWKPAKLPQQIDLSSFYHALEDCNESCDCGLEGDARLGFGACS